MHERPAPTSAEIVPMPAPGSSPNRASAPGDGDPQPSPAPCHYRPSAFYWRRQIRNARTLEGVQTLGLAVVTELEQLKAWVREECGKIPPRFLATNEEARDKGWGATGRG